MDLENLVYVVLAVIYFLSRVLKKRKEKPVEEQEEGSQPKQKRKPISFEDLLKEFGADQLDEKKEEAEEPEFEEVEDVDEYSSRRPDEEARTIFEKSIKDAELVAKTKEPEDDKKLVFKEFKAYQEEEDSNELVSEIKELLQSEDGGKKAIVLGEILNRKY